jgi:hypothetical protein
MDADRGSFKKLMSKQTDPRLRLYPCPSAFIRGYFHRLHSIIRWVGNAP